MRVAFAGSPEFAAAHLRGLAQSEHEMTCVLTRPDKKTGRGGRIQETAVAREAHASCPDVPIFKLPTLQASKTLAFRHEIASDPVDVLIVIAYGLLIPPWLLTWPRIAAMNVHGSLLPRWRGAAPVERAIIEGDEETGVSFMAMTPALDAGPVYGTVSVPIGSRDTAGDVMNALAQVSVPGLLQVLQDFEDGKAHLHPQDAAQATVAPAIAGDDRLLDPMQHDAVRLSRTVRALQPHRSARLDVEGRQISVRATQAHDVPHHLAPGRVVLLGTERLAISCTQGLLELVTVVPGSGKPMSGSEFARGHLKFQVPTMELTG